MSVYPNPLLADLLARTRPVAPHHQSTLIERRALFLVSRWDEAGGYQPGRPGEDEVAAVCIDLWRRGLLERGASLDKEGCTTRWFITQRGAEILACHNHGPLFGLDEELGE